MAMGGPDAKAVAGEPREDRGLYAIALEIQRRGRGLNVCAVRALCSARSSRRPRGDASSLSTPSHCTATRAKEAYAHEPPSSGFAPIRPSPPRLDYRPRALGARCSRDGVSRVAKVSLSCPEARAALCWRDANEPSSPLPRRVLRWLRRFAGRRALRGPAGARGRSHAAMGVPLRDRPEGITAMANQFGREGWDMAAAAGAGWGSGFTQDHTMVWCFKRPLP